MTGEILKKQMVSSPSTEDGAEFHPNFRIEKKELLDTAFSEKQPESVAELGCVWGIDCAYGRYVLEKFRPKSITMIDTHWTESALEKVGKHQEIKIFQRNFGEISMPETLGHVDAIILFDVLLHQVAPDWDRLLQIYAPYTRSFVIFNQQWIGSPLSIRLLDMGRDEYFRNVPHDPTNPSYQKLFDNMYTMHPEHNRIWRDVHHIWQWGITSADLLFTMDRLGFQLDYFKSYGELDSLPNFSEEALIFRERRP